MHKRERCTRTRMCRVCMQIQMCTCTPCTATPCKPRMCARTSCTFSVVKDAVWPMAGLTITVTLPLGFTTAHSRTCSSSGFQGLNARGSVRGLTLSSSLIGAHRFTNSSLTARMNSPAASQDDANLAHTRADSHDMILLTRNMHGIMMYRELILAHRNGRCCGNRRRL